MNAALPADPALPLLAQALDETAMAGVFADVLRGQGLAVERCEIERIKYRPRRNCTLAYRLHLRDPADGRVFEQRVAARLCSAGDSARRLVRAAAAPLQASAAGPALHHLPALDMLSWWWPNDAKLAAPRVLADARAMHEQVLPELVAAISAGRGRLLGHEVEIVQAVPEQRLCARVDLQWSEGDRRVARRAYAKSGREPDDATAHAMLRVLQDSPAGRDGRLRTPCALLWQPAFELRWQEALPGCALLDLPLAHAARLAPALGVQLAALHGTPVAAAHELTLDCLRTRLIEVVEVLGLALPETRAALQHAATDLVEGFVELAGQATCTLHGDLHPRNVLADGDTLSLIDLDGLQRGPAMLELGSWMAEGITRAMLAGAAPQRDRTSWEALLHAYADAGGERPREAALAWATAWNLLCERAWRCVVNLKPGRFALAPALIAQAALLADANRLEPAL